MRYIVSDVSPPLCRRDEAPARPGTGSLNSSRLPGRIFDMRLRMVTRGRARPITHSGRFTHSRVPGAIEPAMADGRKPPRETVYWLRFYGLYVTPTPNAPAVTRTTRQTAGSPFTEIALRNDQRPGRPSASSSLHSSALGRKVEFELP
eukprot:6635133-Prymnesium_polylepis.1